MQYFPQNNSGRPPLMTFKHNIIIYARLSLYSVSFFDIMLSTGRKNQIYPARHRAESLRRKNENSESLGDPGGQRLSEPVYRIGICVERISKTADRNVRILYFASKSCLYSFALHSGVFGNFIGKATGNKRRPLYFDSRWVCLRGRNFPDKYYKRDRGALSFLRIIGGRRHRLDIRLHDPQHCKVVSGQARFGRRGYSRGVWSRVSPFCPAVRILD